VHENIFYSQLPWFMLANQGSQFAKYQAKLLGKTIAFNPQAATGDITGTLTVRIDYTITGEAGAGVYTKDTNHPGHSSLCGRQNQIYDIKPGAT